MPESTEIMENKILRFATTDNAVKAKAFVEIINSIDCAQAHVKLRYNRLGWVGRLKDSITGAGARRQQVIDANLLTGLQSLWDIAQDLHLNQTNLASVAATLGKEVKLLQENMGVMGKKILDLMNSLDKFYNSVQEKLRFLENEVNRIGCLQKARLQLDSSAINLKNGKYDSFSTGGQLCLVVSNLYHGPFYDAIRKYPDCSQELMNIAAGTLGKMLADKLLSDSGSPKPWRAWHNKKCDYIEKNILDFLTGPLNVAHKPVTAKILQPNLENGRIPKFISPASLASRVLDELFDARRD